MGNLRHLDAGSRVACTEGEARHEPATPTPTRPPPTDYVTPAMIGLLAVALLCMTALVIGGPPDLGARLQPLLLPLFGALAAGGSAWIIKRQGDTQAQIQEVHKLTNSLNSAAIAAAKENVDKAVVLALTAAKAEAKAEGDRRYNDGLAAGQAQAVTVLAPVVAAVLPSAQAPAPATVATAPTAPADPHADVVALTPPVTITVAAPPEGK